MFNKANTTIFIDQQTKHVIIRKITFTKTKIFIQNEFITNNKIKLNWLRRNHRMNLTNTNINRAMYSRSSKIIIVRFERPLQNDYYEVTRIERSKEKLHKWYISRTKLVFNKNRLRRYINFSWNEFRTRTCIFNPFMKKLMQYTSMMRQIHKCIELHSSFYRQRSSSVQLKNFTFNCFFFFLPLA